jgi:hypothetical protein
MQMVVGAAVTNLKGYTSVGVVCFWAFLRTSLCSVACTSSKFRLVQQLQQQYLQQQQQQQHWQPGT